MESIMNIKKIVFACATVSLLCGENAFSKSVEEVEKGRGIRGSTIEEGIVSKRASIFGEQVSRKRSKSVKTDEDSDVKADQGKKTKLKKNKKNMEAIPVLAEMKGSEIQNIPADLFSGGKSGTFKDVGSEFGTHIQDVWNLSSDETAKSEAVNALLTDLSNTATALALSGEDISGKKDKKFDFSEIDENDFQGIVAKNDFSKAFYLNAIAKIADLLYKGTEGHVFWHGMFKVMVKLLVVDHYLI